MRKSLLTLAFVLFSVSSIALSKANSQEPAASAAASSPERASDRPAQAVALLRLVNTVEVTYKFQRGGYVGWDTLISDRSFSSKLSKWAGNGSGSAVAKAPEIAPGWNLRLNVGADHKSYDLLLEDTTDQKCGYAAVTDERGVIRQGKAIDCSI